MQNRFLSTMVGGILLLAWPVTTQAATELPLRQLRSELRDLDPTLARHSEWPDERMFAVISTDWLKKRFLPAFERMVFDLRLTFTYEGFDCDNFAALFLAQLRLQQFLDSGADLPPAGGIVTVEQRRTFGIIPAQEGTIHAVVLLLTDEGWWVIEPQGLTSAPIAKYPNRSYLRKVYF